MRIYVFGHDAIPYCKARSGEGDASTNEDEDPIDRIANMLGVRTEFGKPLTTFVESIFYLPASDHHDGDQTPIIDCIQSCGHGVSNQEVLASQTAHDSANQRCQEINGGHNLQRLPVGSAEPGRPCGL